MIPAVFYVPAAVNTCTNCSFYNMFAVSLQQKFVTYAIW